MRTLLLGIDSGTQSTKVVVVDARDGKVLASATQEYDLIPNLPPGAKEQHPHTWRDATASGIRRALRQAKAIAAEVKAIGVSGQQHGFVPLGRNNEVIRPAKLWCDTSTAAECEEIMERLGSLNSKIARLESRSHCERRRRRQHDGRHWHRQYPCGSHHCQLRDQWNYLRLRGKARG